MGDMTPIYKHSPFQTHSVSRLLFFLVTSLLTVTLAACASQANLPAAPTVDISAASTQAVATIFAQASQTAQAALPTATATPIPSATLDPKRTPPALPVGFTTDLLNKLDTPHTYLQDQCQYLRAKWDPNNAAPGTVVMPIMFHSITKGDVTEASQVSLQDFRKLMNDLHEMGFEAIAMQQAADFLYKNAKIPQRSVLLIVDDRKYREYFDITFFRYWKDWGWKVVNAWISHPDTIQPLWDENAALESEGWVDHQAHGVIHNINMSDQSSDDFLKGELQGSIDAIQAHFNKTPVAIIWPGGGFGKRPAEAARKYNFKLGFTINPRGPLLFNWIPLADAADPSRPSFIPEGAIGDPLMTLPRYWDTDARTHLDTVRQIGAEAAVHADQVRATEIEYYDIMCSAKYGPMPVIGP
jgi:hypothetical protein